MESIRDSLAEELVKMTAQVSFNFLFFVGTLPVMNYDLLTPTAV